MRGAIKRNPASKQRDGSGGGKNYRQDDQARQSRDAEDCFAQLAREARAEQKTQAASGNCQEQLFAEKQTANQKIGCAQGFHQTNFGATLHGRGGRSGADGKSGGNKRGDSNNPEKKTDAREYAAFGLCNTADGLNVSAREDFLNLAADRSDVRRTIPAVEFRGRHLVGILLREGISGLGEGANKELAKFAGLAAEILGHGKWAEHGGVLRIARGDDASDGRERFAGADAET